MTNEEKDTINQQHFDNPQPGDYWHERFSPYFVVLEIINNENIVICDKTKEVDKNHWTFDLTQSKLVTKSYFNRVKYNSIPGFCADVASHPEFSEEWWKIPLDERKEYLFVAKEEPELEKEYDTSINRIVCAANLYSDGTLITGARHFDSVMRKTIETINPDRMHWVNLGHTQGFIDKFGEFKTREEAREIAAKAGQIIRRVGGDHNKLFSENLY